MQVMAWIVRRQIDKFNELDESSQNLILSIAGIAAAIGPLLVVGGQLMSSVNAISAAINGLSATTTAGIAAVAPYVAVFAAAVGSLKLFYSEIKNNENATKEQSNQLIETSKSYEEYIKRVEEANGVEDDYNAIIWDTNDALAAGLTQLRQQSKSIDVLTKDEYELAKMTEMAALDVGYYADQAEIAAAQSEILADATEDIASAIYDLDFGSFIGLAQDYAEIQEEINDKQEKLAALLEMSGKGGYLDDVYYSAQDVRDEVMSLQDDIVSLKDEMKQAATEMVWSMAMASVDFSTATQTEISALLGMATELGIVTEESLISVGDDLSDMLDNLGIDADEMGDGILAILGAINNYQIADKSFTTTETYIRHYENVYKGYGSGGQQIGDTNFVMEAEGDYVRTSSPTAFMTSEYGQREEAFFIPEGKTLWDVAPQSAVVNALGGIEGAVDRLGSRRSGDTYNFNAVLQPDQILQTIDQLKVLNG